MLSSMDSSDPKGSGEDSLGRKSAPVMPHSKDVEIPALPESNVENESGQEPESDIDGQTQAPIQKRRRVTRACDEVS